MVKVQPIPQIPKKFYLDKIYSIVYKFNSQFFAKSLRVNDFKSSISMFMKFGVHINSWRLWKFKNHSIHRWPFSVCTKNVRYSILQFSFLLMMKVHRIKRNLLILPKSMIVCGHDFFRCKLGRKASHRASLQKKSK